MKDSFSFILIGICVGIASVTSGYFLYMKHQQNDESVAVFEPQPFAQPEVSEQTEAQTPPEVKITDDTTTHGITIARIRPDGNAVIAGLAPEGSTVNLILRNSESDEVGGGEIIGTAIANGKNEWVIVPDPLEDKDSHLLSIEIITPDGERQVGATALVVQMSEIKGETPLVALVPYADDTAPVKILQAPDDVAVSVVATGPSITIRSVQTSDSGYLSLSGMARGGAEVQLSMNGVLADSVKPSPDGTYNTGQQIDKNPDRIVLVVTLRDDKSNAIASARVRLTPGHIEEMADNNSLVVVRKGDALWRIAYQTYGKGLRYVDIYRKNQNQISDPDLIYPDQIFVLPRG